MTCALPISTYAQYSGFCDGADLGYSVLKPELRLVFPMAPVIYSISSFICSIPYKLYICVLFEGKEVGVMFERAGCA